MLWRWLRIDWGKPWSCWWRSDPQERFVAAAHRIGASPQVLSAAMQREPWSGPLTEGDAR